MADQVRGPLEVFFGDDRGAQLRLAFTLLRNVELSDAEVSTALQQLEHESAIGPMLNPTAYLDGRRFDNIAYWKRVLGAVADLKRVLREADHG
jgi:hypothetical protein